MSLACTVPMSDTHVPLSLSQGQRRFQDGDRSVACYTLPE
jgi:hypothetical protein